MDSYRLVLNLLKIALFSSVVFAFDYPKYETRSRLNVTNDGGYTDLVVAIGTTVAEDPMLIDSIKGAITTFSRKLHELTGFYLGNVRILVPGSWAPNPQLYSTKSWETFDNSDIRVDNVGDGDDTNRRVCRDSPFTVKPSQCGSSGQFIVLTPDFIQNPDIAAAFGGYGKVLLREWAKYRWGAFDESPTEDGFHFYASSSGDIEATRCSSQRRGVWRNAAGRPCQRLAHGLPEGGCRFRDQETGSEAGEEASLMYRQYIDSIETFCRNPGGNTDAKLVHNIEAPNQHNVHCDRRSVSEVLREHLDYAEANQRVGVKWTRPQYDIVHQTNGNIVLVLDRSSSMNENNRIDILRQAAYNFISRVIPDGYKLGLVEFNHEAKPIEQLRIIDDRSRIVLLGALPLIVPGGSTSIGDGVLEGLKVLAGGPNNLPEGGQMIVISDGVNTMQPNIARVQMSDGDRISTVTIYTIAVGPEVDNDLEALANSTGGRHYQHTDFSTTLFDVFSQFGFDSNGLKSSECVTAHWRNSSCLAGILATIGFGVRSSVDLANPPSEIRITYFEESILTRRNAEFYSTATVLEANTQLLIEVYIDDTVEGDILFLVGSNNTVESLIVNVRLPDGSSLNGGNVDVDMVFNLIRISTDRVMPGIWTLVMSNLDTMSKQLSIVVEGSVSSSSAPISVDANWALGSMSPPEVQTLYVTVMKGYIPVANATVYATVTHNRTEIDQTLYDDGVGADMLANDGIYSAYFTRVNGAGRYGAKISVEGVQGGTRVLMSRCLGESQPDTGGLTARSITADTETGPFQRVVDAGSFKCIDGNSCAGGSIGPLYGPAKVSDLRVENINQAASEVDLVFTAPGNDLMDGTASMYTIRFARSFDALHHNFDGSRQVTALPASPVYISSRPVKDPRAARLRQVYTLRITETGNFSYVFGLTATDNNGNVSPVSNFASVSAKYLDAPFSSIPTTASSGDGVKDPNGDGSQNAIVNPTELVPVPGAFPWYLLLLGLLVIIILLLLMLLFLWKRRSKENDDAILPPTSPRQSEAVTFDNPALRATLSANNVAYSPTVANGSVYEGVQTPPRYADNFVTATPTAAYAHHQSYADNFVNVPPTASYGVPVSNLRQQSDEVARRKNLDSHDPYEEVRGVGTLNRDEVRYSSVTSRPHRATDEGRRSHAKIKEDDWRAKGGQNYNMFGVVPDQDATKLASIKSRGEMATEEKIPL